jgi:hypothetical protein
MATNKIDQLLMVSDFNENWYLGVFWSEEFVVNDEICIQGHFYEATIFKMAANKIVKLSMVSDFNENWYLRVFWSEQLVGALNFDIGVVWGLLCLHTNTIKPSYYYYYYYYSSSSSSNELVRPNSQRLMIRSLLNYTGRWIPSQEMHSGLGIFKMAAVAMETVNICQNLWPHSYRKLPKGFPQDLAYILSIVGRIFWPKQIANEWPPFWKWPPTTSEIFQCSLISMKMYIYGYFEGKNWLAMMKNAFRIIFIFKMAANKIGKISVFSDFNENWYLGSFWSEELIGNDEYCIQGHFYFQNGRRRNRHNFNVL